MPFHFLSEEAGGFSSAPANEDFRIFRAGLLLDGVRVEAIAALQAGELNLGPLYRTRSGLRNSDKSFGKKFLRGQAIMGGIELASLGILLVLPKAVSRWDDLPLSQAKAHFIRAWSQPPVWDKDHFYHDYLGHPFAGSIYYNMVRSQDATPMQSFLFSTLQCVVWEYLIESVAEQPSIQDLLLTSTIGSLMGEVIHRWTLSMLRKDHLTLLQKALVFLANPSYVINNGFRAP